MQINEMQLSFIQIECLAQPLRSLHPPNIPYSFLLSGPLFENQFAQSLQNGGPCQAPWRGGYGKLFWSRYIPQRPPTTKDLWRVLTPLSYALGLSVTPKWPDSAACARCYFYPWGIGVAVDIKTKGAMDLDRAVALALGIRRSSQFHVEVNGVTRDTTLNGLIDVVLAQMREKAYGSGIAKGDRSEIFSVVTVLDADGTDPTQPVADSGDIHRALEAMSGWNTLWKSLKLGPLADATVDIKRSPPGHLLYGGRRGRVVWFPGNFRSVAAYKHTISCYHQNLTVATLQVESLCRIAQDTANVLSNNQSLAACSVAYRSCAQLAAGTLGRLYGGTFDTYRSYSVRHQIQHMYKDAVNTVRTQFGMQPLNP